MIILLQAIVFLGIENSNVSDNSNNFRHKESQLKWGLWMPRIGGTVDSGAQRVRLETTLGLSESETLFRPEIQVALSSDWDLAVLGSSFATSETVSLSSDLQLGNLVINTGDTVYSEIDYRFFEANFFYKSKKPLEGDFQKRSVLYWQPTVGLRWLEADVKVKSGSDKFDESGDWSSFSFGGVLFLDVKDEKSIFKNSNALWRFSSGGDVGITVGGNAGFVWSVRSGLELFLDSGCSFFFGYRLLEPELKKEGFNISPGLQGLYLGGFFNF